MALWTMFVDAEGMRYSTQITADNARGAVRKLLGSGSVKRVIAREYADAWPSSYSMQDVVQLDPVAGQRNTYLCALQRKGKGEPVAIVIVRTVSR